MNKYISVLLSFFLILGFLSCHEDDETAQIVKLLISPEGGEITSFDGRLTLDFPPGALDEDTEITIKRINANELGPEFDGIDSDRIYDLGPDGLQFNVPVKATLRLDQQPLQPDGSFSADLALLFSLSEGELGIVENIDIDLDGDNNTVKVSGDLNHFSALTDSVGFFGFSQISIQGRVEEVPDSLMPNGMFTASVSLISFQNILQIIDGTEAIEQAPFYQDSSVSPVVFLSGFTTGILDIGEPGAFQTQLFEADFEYQCLEGEGLYRSSLTFFTIFDPEFIAGIAGDVNIDNSFDQPDEITFNFEKTVRCVDETGSPEDEDPTPTPDDGEGPKADFDIEIFPEEESPEGALDFTHFFNVTDCPQKIAEIKITNTGTERTSIIVDTPSSSIDFRIKGEGPPSIPKLTLELDPNEMITIEVFFNCDTTQSFDTTIFIDGILLQAGGSVPGSGMSRSVMVDGTIVIP